MARYIKQDATTVPQINTELEKIELAIQDTLSRKGDTPNAMTAPLDMNGERLLNLPAPVADTDPLRKIDGEVYVTAAAVSAAEALASEQAAAVSAQEAAVSESVAISAAEVSEGLFDELNTLYLGSFTTGPATDNQGDPLVQGVLYYNTVQKVLFVFNGSIWVEAASQQAANNAAISAQEAANSAAAALASQQASATSETNAAASASQAFVSASAADGSAANALLSEQAADAAASAAEDARDEAVAYASAFSKGLIFIGVYDASTGVFPTLPDPLIGNPFWIINVTGTISGTVYDQGDTLIYDSTTEVWIKLDTTDRVVSVAGKVGAVTLDKADVGLSNVDNTSDLNKPISTATQTALGGKANTAHTHVISDVTGLQSALDAKVNNSQLATAATANSVAQRTSDGSINAVNVYASGKLGVGTSSPTRAVDVISDSGAIIQVRGGSDVNGGAAFFVRSSANSGTLFAAGDRAQIFGGTPDAIASIFTASGVPLVFDAAAAERMRIDSSGNVGIGTSSPIGKLDVSDGTNPLSFDSATYNEIQSYNRPLLLNRQGQNVGIGTTSPNAKFEVLGGNIRSTLVGASSSTFRGFEMAVDTAVTASLQNRPSDGETRLSSGFSGFGGYTTFYTDGAERMLISSSGNVGIGTSSPTVRIQTTDGNASTETHPSVFRPIVNIYSAGNESTFGLTLGSRPTNANQVQGGYIESGSSVTYRAGFFHMFDTAGTERMRIDSSGNVLVGTTGISGDGPNSSGLYFEASEGNMKLRAGSANTCSQFYHSSSSASAVGSISVTASSTSYNTSSDYRLKEDWQPMEGNIDRLMQLKPCNFAWKVDGSRVDGFLAHEAQEVVPEAVHGTKDAMRTEQYEVSPAVYEDVVIPAEFDEDGNEISPERTEQKLVKEAVMGEREVPEYQGIDQSKIVPLLTAALQDAVKKIEALEARIEALEG